MTPLGAGEPSPETPCSRSESPTTRRAGDALGAGQGPHPVRPSPAPSGEPKTAYAVSSGECSDYSVHAIFDTEERAIKYLEDQGRVRVKGTEYYDQGREWWSPPDKPQEWAGMFIEEFNYYDGDVLPLSG